jgi:hypothetical protein
VRRKRSIEHGTGSGKLIIQASSLRLKTDKKNMLIPPVRYSLLTDKRVSKGGDNSVFRLFSNYHRPGFEEITQEATSSKRSKTRIIIISGRIGNRTFVVIA